MQSSSSLGSMILGAFALVGAASCAIPLDEADPATTGAQEQELGGAPRRIQAGTSLSLLGTTDDDYAVFWDAGVVYAAPLRIGAQRRRLADAAQPPTTMIVGRVVLIWPEQPFFAFPSPGPLVVWTAHGGAHQAASASWPPLLSSISASTAVSPDGSQILFTSNVSSDGATGDLVLASPELGQVRTLVAGAPVSPLGGCPPHVGFDRLGTSAGGRWRSRADDADDPLRARRRRANPVVAACGPNQAQPSLAKWVNGERRELAAGLAASAWTVDVSGDHLHAVLADRSSVVFDAAGSPTVIERRLNFGWVTPEGVVITKVVTSPTTAELERTTFGPGPTTTKLMDVPRPLGFMFTNHLPQAVPHYTLTVNPMSTDGSFFGGWTSLDPNTGLTDAILVDTERRRLVTVNSAANALPSNELSTRDAQHMLLYTIDDQGNATMLDAARDGSRRTLSTGNTTLEHYGVEGSVVAFADDAAGNPADLLSTVNIKLVDLASAQPPTTVATQAHQLFFLAQHRRLIVYSSSADPANAGVFVARVR